LFLRGLCFGFRFAERLPVDIILQAHLIDGGQCPTCLICDELPDEPPFVLFRQREVTRVLEKEETSLG
jgi:hypothetical protein